MARHSFVFVDFLGDPKVYDTVCVFPDLTRLGVVVALDDKIGGGTAWVKFAVCPYDKVEAVKISDLRPMAWVEKIPSELPSKSRDAGSGDEGTWPKN